jgi:hypothetical protein
LHDILGLTDDAPPNPLRVFANVVAGQLELNDRLLFCLPTLLDYFSLEKLRRTLLDHKPNEAARLLEQALVDVDPSMSFGALMAVIHDEPEVVAVPSVSHPVTVPNQRFAPQRSMDDLIGTERNTERILAPSIWPALRLMLQSLGRGLDRLVRTVILRQPPRRRLSSSATSPESFRTAPPAADIQSAGPGPWPRLGFELRRVGRQVRFGLQSLPALFRRSRTSSAEPTTPYARQSLSARLLAWWQGTNRNQRFVIAGILIVVIVLFSLLARGNAPTTTTTANQGTTVESELSRAEAALLYGGESVAREAAAAAEVKLAAMSTRRRSDKQLHDQLAIRLDAVKKQLAHQSTLTGGEQILDFSSLQGTLAPRQLYLTTRQLVAHDPEHQLTAIVDRSTSQGRLAPSTLDVGKIQTGTVINSNVVFLTDRPGLIELNPVTTTWKPFDSTFPTPRPTVQALTTFQNRIYLLDRGANRVLRFTRGSSSYGTATSWLKDAVTLADARDIALDGSVYILRSGGKVEEYFNGRRGTLTLAMIDPVLSNPTRLWTSADSQSFYLLDPDHRRIVVFKKDGQLRQQLSDDAWDDVRDMAIDEAGHVLFVINGTRLLRYQLPTI